MDLMLGLTDIKTIVRDLWTLRLSKLLSRLESPQRGDSESQATPPAEDSGDGAPERSAKRGGKGLESPKLVETIALCYMGMLILRLPVGLGELYRWIEEEDVLYVRAIRGVPVDMLEKLPGEYHKFLDTTVMLQPEDMHNAISDLAIMYDEAFGLALPPLNYEVLLYKYIMNLALPLEVFPAVRGLAHLTRSDFRYLTMKGTRRKRGSAFPELQLISLLVIAVKLLYPFDGVKRHPRTIHETATQTVDWKSWEEHRRDSAKRPPGATLARGSEIDVRDTDVFKMSQQDLDSYMNWYQKMWVREPRPGANESVNKEILDMFPLTTLGPSCEQTSRQQEQEVERIATLRAQSTTSSMIFQRPVTDEEALDQQADVKRPGEDYIPYKSADDLPESAKVFFDAAAETACTSVRILILAVAQTEARITTWKKARRRAEVTGQDIDLDAELRGFGDTGRVDTRMQQEMEAMNIGEEIIRGNEGDGGDSDTDMQMMA